MGYGFYYISAIGYLPEPELRRPAGYMVQAECDKRGCHEEIDRGLGCICGSGPHDQFSDEPGCGRILVRDEGPE